MRRLFLILLLVGIYSVSPACAQIYKWVDKNGTVTYSDTPPPQKQGVQTINPTRYNNINTPAADANAADSGQGAQENPSYTNSVELYVTDWCPYCKKAENFFRSRGIDFVAYNIDKDKAAKRRKDRLDSRNGVPFAVVNGVKIHGYSAARYERALNQ